MQVLIRLASLYILLNQFTETKRLSSCLKLNLLFNFTTVLHFQLFFAYCVSCLDTTESHLECNALLLPGPEPTVRPVRF